MCNTESRKRSGDASRVGEDKSEKVPDSPKVRSAVMAEMQRAAVKKSESLSKIILSGRLRW